MCSSDLLAVFFKDGPFAWNGLIGFYLPLGVFVVWLGVTTVLLLVFFAVCSMLWIIATFRPELGADTVRVLHDSGWLIFVMVFPAYTLQMICQAIAGFIDHSPNPTWPRWAAYFNLWVGFAGMGGGLAVFFKDGPFAWNGLIGFYLPLGVFVVWLGVTTVLLTKAIKRQAAEGESGPAGLVVEPKAVKASA